MSEPVPTESNQKKFIRILLYIIAFGVAYFLIDKFYFSQPSFDENISKTAKNINKHCPVMVDNFIRLDNAEALPGKIFQYNYTFVNISVAEANIDTIEKYIVPGVVNNVKTNPDLKYFRENKIIMVYSYKDKYGQFVYKFSVTPEQYGDGI